MAAYNNLDGFQDNHYLARSWALLNLEGNWLVTIGKLGLVSLIPIVGPLISLGFIVEWARQIAWGASSSPNRVQWNWGALLSTGWRSFLVGLGYGAILSLIGAIAGFIPLIGNIFSAAYPLLMILLSVIVMVATMHAAIYQRAGAGFNFSRVFQLVDHDSIGLARVLGFSFLTSTALAIVYGIVIIGTSLPLFVSIYREISTMPGGIEYNEALFNAFMVFFAGMIPGAFACYVANCFVGTLIQMLSYGMVGLWMRQFDVPNWRSEDDPLPPTIDSQSTYVPYGQQPMSPGDQYGQYQQYGQQYGQPQQQYSQVQQPPETPTWQQMDDQAQQLWQQQYEQATRRAAQAQTPAQQPVYQQPIVVQQPVVAPQPAELPQPVVEPQPQPQPPAAEPQPGDGMFFEPGSTDDTPTQ